MPTAVATQAEREQLVTAAVSYDASVEEGVISGLAYNWGETAYGVKGPTQFARGAFRETLSAQRPGLIPLLWQHRDDLVVGAVRRMEETTEGLLFEAKVTQNSQGKDVILLLKDKAISGVSLGFGALESKNQKVGEDTVRMVSKAYIHELSLVTFPAADQARVRDVHEAWAQPLVDALKKTEGLSAERQVTLTCLLAGTLELEQLEGKVFSTQNLARLKDALSALVDLVSKVDPDSIVSVGESIAATAKRSFMYYDPDEKKRKKMADTRARIRECEIRAREIQAMALSAGNQDEEPKARLFDEIVAEQKEMEKEWRLQAALMDSIHSILRDDDVKDKPGMVKKTVAQFLAAAGE